MDVITSAQMPLARTTLGTGKMELAAPEGVLLPTIRRPEAFGGHMCGMIGAPMGVIEALGEAGIGLIGGHARRAGRGRGLRPGVAAFGPEEWRNGRAARVGVAPESANHVA